METFIIVIVVLFIGIIIFGISANDKRKRATETEEQNLKANGIELSKKTSTYHGTIGIDEKRKKLVLIQNNFTLAQTHIFDFSDIFECELIKDGSTIFRKSASRTIGGALIGGALSGGVGALVGGLSGNTKSTEQVKKVELKIVVKDLSNPSQRFVFFDISADNKILLNTLVQQAEMWKDTISLIIDMEDAPHKIS